jgi:pyruvate/2-oxoglutarate dehydrogenase complex dihydrolipoamide acyltransferase (E2) component
MRRFALDVGRRGRRAHIVHALLEMDVTRVRQHIREHKSKTGASLSFSAFITACLTQAIETNKRVHAYLNWRNQFVIIDDMNVNTMIEVDSRDGKVPMPHTIEAANQKTFREIHDEIRAARARPAST